MSALSESRTSTAIPIETVIGIVAPIIWQWMDSHRGMEAIHIRGTIWRFPYSFGVTYDQLRPFVQQLIGPDLRGMMAGVPG